jgi:CheY-like chemotaxis protein
VDDEPVVLRVIQNILRRYGFRVLGAITAEEACEIFRREPHVDLLLVDVVMPGVNGPELADRLLAKDPGLRVLFTAGMPDSPLIRTRVANRGFDLIAKPFLPAQLAARISEVLGAPANRLAARV